MRPRWGPACSPGMCPDWELNRQPFTLWDNSRPTEPHWSGLNVLYNLNHIYKALFVMWENIPLFWGLWMWTSLGAIMLSSTVTIMSNFMKRKLRYREVNNSSKVSEWGAGSKSSPLALEGLLSLSQKVRWIDGYMCGVVHDKLLQKGSLLSFSGGSSHTHTHLLGSKCPPPEEKTSLNARDW